MTKEMVEFRNGEGKGAGCNNEGRGATFAMTV